MYCIFRPGFTRNLLLRRKNAQSQRQNRGGYEFQDSLVTILVTILWSFFTGHIWIHVGNLLLRMTGPKFYQHHRWSNKNSHIWHEQTRTGQPHWVDIVWTHRVCGNESLKERLKTKKKIWLMRKISHIHCDWCMSSKVVDRRNPGSCLRLRNTIYTIYDTSDSPSNLLNAWPSKQQTFPGKNASWFARDGEGWCWRLGKWSSGWQINQSPSQKSS